MEFPTIFYRTPGIHSAGGKLTYDYVAVPDEEAADRFIDQGYVTSLEAALAPEPKADEPLSARALLEAEAKRLGVSFNRKTSDETLEERITAAQVPE